MEVRGYLQLQNQKGVKNDVKLTEITKTFIEKSKKVHDAKGEKIAKTVFLSL